MLPGIAYTGAISTLNFNQMTDFPVGIGGMMDDGACLGLAICWLASLKKNGSDDTAQKFCADIRRPSLFKKIAHIHAWDVELLRGVPAARQSEVITAKRLALMALVKEGGWTAYEQVSSNSAAHFGNVTREYAAGALAQCSGYIVVVASEVGHGGGHARALRINTDADRSCEFFDPNFGSAKFHSFSRFSTWFSGEYWRACDDLGKGRGCRSFLTSQMAPREPEAKAAAVAAEEPAKKWNPSMGPPPLLSARGG